MSAATISSEFSLDLKGQFFTRILRMDSSKWILARKKGSQEGDDKYMFRLPLRALAPKGDIESYYWYFGELDRQATNDLLRSRDYPRGTFAVRINQKDSRYFSLSIINRVRTGIFLIFLMTFLVRESTDLYPG